MLALLAEAALRSLALGGAVWLGLKLLRVDDPRAHMTAWTVVLVASLSMPLIMHWVMLTLPSAPPPSRLAKIIWVSPGQPLETVQTAEALPPAPGVPPLLSSAVPVHGDVSTTIDWREGRRTDWLGLATGIYAVVAGVLLLRLLTGILLTWRLARAARPLGDGWAAGWNVRVSDSIGVPVTFGSTILLPPECTQWSAEKRQAVLLHERSHVAHGDCYVLLLAAFNRAVFWFSPFVWWQFTRLAELAEMISDDAAIAVLADRRSYAHILLDLAGHVRRAPAGLAMARACTVGRRVERILAETALPARFGWRKQMLLATALAPVVAICAGSIARGTSDHAFAAIPMLRASEPFAADVPPEGREPYTAAIVDPQLVNSYVGYYRLSPRSVFAVTQEGGRLFAQLPGERKLPLFPASNREFRYKAAAARITFLADGERPPAELILHQDGNDLRAARIADVPRRDQQGVEVDADVLDSHVGWYELNAAHALAVTREGDRLFVQVTGRPKFQVLARSEKNFVSANGNAAVIFLREGQGPTTELLLYEPAAGARSATRIDAARATAIQDVFARRVAAAPDRFKDQTPAPGGKATLLQAIEELQRDVPGYERMSPQLADSVREQTPGLHAVLAALGAVESLFFRGVGPGGYDIYGAKFANGFAEFRLLLGTDGKIEDVIFRPDGDDTEGGFTACSDEPTLKPASGAAPIKLLLLNASGADIELFELDAEGKRVPYGVVGDERTVPIHTYVGRPWVVADATGQCRDIVLPGRRARFLTVPPPPAGDAHAASARLTPMPGSEDALRQYIDALGRGEPDYDQMTPELAAQTRQQLVLYQGILAKLGALRAMSFRGVSQLGNDIYMTQFANGSAEWRIGLVKEGKVARLALGPQY